jgi:hypothetical protein
MATIEGIIRPFGIRTVTPSPGVSPIFVPSATVTPNNAMQLGRNGSGKTTTGSYSFSEKWYQTAKEKEVKTQQP